MFDIYRMNYFKNILTNTKILLYNTLHGSGTDIPKRYHTTFVNDDEIEDSFNNSNKDIDEKQMRINILLYIKQFKNTYYKYTNTEKFNEDLYKSFIDENNFDGGETGFDDEDSVRIFDKYILDYIKNRNDIITYLQCKNITVYQKTKMIDLRDLKTSAKEMDILFVIDMPDRDIFDYCYSLVKKNTNCINTKAITLSMVFKFNNDYIRIKLNAYKTNINLHPYLVLEKHLI